MRLTELFLIAIILAGAGAQRADASDRSFITGVAGSNPSNPKEQARTYFNMGPVRALVERLESGPLSEAEIRTALKGSDATLEDLVRLKILRRDAAGYVIGFNYFTLQDMRLIHKSAERFVPSLVAGYGDHAGEFDRIFARYPVPSVGRKALAAAVIGGFGLNWDALQLT